MVDNNAELYIGTLYMGGGKHPKFVRLPSNAWGSHHRVQVDEGVFFNMTSWIVGHVGADISPIGREVIVKTYLQIYYLYIPDGDYYAHMTSPPVLILYDIELQGEAVCFDSVGSGYYTVSEGTRPALHYYRRSGNSPGIVG
ncbi:uncharacterized protein LOC127857640 isoform X2 [Dreissena polymorpha]|uniref:uncharacterized protein LOC127857640 isoform X2 n=1 Tax=Dreissena polymorpha TaxID=45954 RepID=UPI00226470EB|nr:uncharacterized protein LOC127857640 isoform X2 [Dreissena polymorpha]